MKILKKYGIFILSFISLVVIVCSSMTNAKYYTQIIEQVWKTNFTYYGVVNPGDVKYRYTIDAQSADNPSAMFDGNIELNHKEANWANNLKNRWTNWSDSGTNKGEDARILISFVRPVYITTLRLYYFVDNNGTDIPRDITLKYTEHPTSNSITVIEDKSLEELTNSFSKASTASSIFRSTGGTPVYSVNGVDTAFTGQDFYATPPNTTIYFNDEKSRVCLSSFEIYMQAGSNWYVGLTEMAFDWIFADYDPNTEKLVECSSTWYGRM